MNSRLGIIVLLKALHGAVNRCLRPLDQLFACKDRTDYPGPIFIMGLPRSGTTLLYQLMLKRFTLAYLPNLYEYFHGIPVLIAHLSKRGVASVDFDFKSNYGRTDGLFAPSEHFGLWEKWFTKSRDRGIRMDRTSLDPAACEEINERLVRLESVSGCPYLFKSLYLILCIDALQSCLLRSKYVFIRRNLVDVILSVFKGRMSRRNPEAWWSVPYPGFEKSRSFSVLDQVVIQCMELENLLATEYENLGESKAKQIEYAALCDNPARQLEEIRAWLGPDYKPRESFIAPQHFTHQCRGPEDLRVVDEINTRLAHFRRARDNMRDSQELIG